MQLGLESYRHLPDRPSLGPKTRGVVDAPKDPHVVNMVVRRKEIGNCHPWLMAVHLHVKTDEYGGKFTGYEWHQPRGHGQGSVVVAPSPGSDIS